MFDDTEADEPWLPCRAPRWCADIGDRISASIVSKRLPFVYHEGRTGMILTPSRARVRCSYFGDGGTMPKRCHGQRGCVPGCCDTNGEPNWCADVRLESQAVYQCAFRPEKLDAMLRHHELRRSQGKYNEVILDPSGWSAETVEAFFFVARDGTSGEEAARRVHGAFHARHPDAAVPLVRLELGSASQPLVRVA